MTAVMWIVFSGIVTALVIAACKTRHPLKAFRDSALQGLCAMAAVNLTAWWSGLSLGITAFSLTTAALLGIPGVTMMVLLQTMCFVPL